MIFFGRSSLEHALTEYTAHYHCERNHQGLSNRLIHRSGGRKPRWWSKRRRRLGGMLNFYYLKLLDYITFADGVFVRYGFSSADVTCENPLSLRVI